MAKPIDPTPPLTGADAVALALSLERHASSDEMARRVKLAKEHSARLMAAKSVSKNTG